MLKDSFHIRPYQLRDETSVIKLWRICGLIVPWNNPYNDIIRKLDIQPELFLVGLKDRVLISTVMGGYEGHRGWINYLAVHPDFQKRGYGSQILKEVEEELKNKGCPKINLMIRKGNNKVIDFYQKLGYSVEDVTSMGKRIKDDHSKN